MFGIWLASFLTAYVFIYFVFYPVVAYFKDAKGMSKATVFNTAGLTYLQDFANTPT